MDVLNHKEQSLRARLRALGRVAVAFSGGTDSSLLLAVAMLMRKNRSALIWAVVAAVFGLVFGPLMYLEYFAINGGWEMFLAMWVNGIPFDLAHCGGNFVLTLVLFQPLYRVMAHFLGDPEKIE